MRSRGWSTAVALAATASLLGLPSLASASAQTRTVTVKQTVYRGANPHVPWVDRGSRVLHVGKRQIHLTMKGHIWSVRRVGERRFVVQVGSGYVLHPGRFLYVVGAGRPLMLTSHFSGQYQLSLNPRGSVAYSAYVPHHKYAVLRVQRVTDGKVLGHQRVRSGVVPLAFRDGQVWRDQGKSLAVWDLRSHTMRRTSHPASIDIDLDHGFAVRRGASNRIVYFPLDKTAHWQPWHTTGIGTGLAGWSPDGHFVALFRPPYFHEEGNGDLDSSRIEVRNARTGALVRTFRLSSGADGFYLFAARWEDDHHLLVPATLRYSGNTAYYALLRLRTDGRYNAASRTGSGQEYWSSPPVIPGWTPNGTER